MSGVDPSLLNKLRSATEFLESFAADHSLLQGVPAEDRSRFHLAVAQAYNPDPVIRKSRLKAAERERNANRLQQDTSLLDETGIRCLRRKPVFTTPNVFAPEDFIPQDVHADDDRRKAAEPRHCYVCKRKFSDI